MSEWLRGLIAGVVATLIGFAVTVSFTVWWDNRKFDRDSSQRDEAVLAAVREELLSNIMLIKEHDSFLQHELSVITDKKTVIQPLTPLKIGSWDVLKINIPKKLKSGDALVKVREASQRTDRVNEIIRSRENYRIQNEAMSNFHSRIKMYDEILLNQEQVLLKALEELKPLL